MPARRNAGWLLLALLPPAFGVAASPEVPPAIGANPTLGDVDRTLDRAMESMWRLLQPLQDDARSRGIAADIERHVMSDATLQEIESLRASLPGKVDPGTGRIPDAAIAPLELVLQRDNCRFASILSHWSDEALRPLQADMQGTLARLPAASREILEKEMTDILAAFSPDRKQLEADLVECASLELWAAPPAMRRMEAANRGMAQLRQKLAAVVNAGMAFGQIEKVRNLRSSPCPAPRPPTRGNPRPQLARQAPSAGEYPPLARSLGIEGTVRVRIEIDEGGCVVAATVMETSASGMLDQAAVRRALEQEWVPAEVDGKAVPFAAIQPVNYSLKEE